MVFERERNTLEPIHFADGVISDSVLEASRQCDATWLPVESDLVTILPELSHRPGVRLIQAGSTRDEFPRPFYIARAAHQGSYYFGVCAFHLSGARIRVDSLNLVSPKYDVLVGYQEQYRWFPVRTSARAANDIPVGAPFLLYGSSGGRSPTLVRYHLQQQVIWGSIADDEDFQAISDDPKADSGFEDVTEYDVFISVKQTSASADKEDRIKAMTGRFFPDNHSAHVKKGDRYSTAVTFPQPLASVPEVITSFDYLDMSNYDCALRLRLYPQNITRESFICNQESWKDTCLYNCGETWAAINEPGWQTGVFKTKPISDGSLFDDRVTFAVPFTSPPMVFVCFSGLDMAGRWDMRVQATGVDHLGFSISILKPDTKLGVASISWVAIPGDDILRRKNAWIGRFSTDMGKQVSGKDGEWSGRVNFGFEFKRKPRIFVGVDQLSFNNDKNARLCVEASNVSKEGMDWYIRKWHVSILRGAGASFLAMDFVYTLNSI